MLALSICSAYQRIQVSQRKPTSPWMPFPTLIASLAKILPPDAINLIVKHHRDNRVSSYQFESQASPQ